MKLAIASDLHLEFGDIDLANDQGAEVLILSGDIMLAHLLHDWPREKVAQSKLDKRRQLNVFRGFLDRVSAAFPHVVYVAGNHEFYNGKWVGSIGDLRKECNYYANIHFLERDSWTYKDIVFVGATLWTNMNRSDPVTLHGVTDIMTDFHVITNDDHGFTKLRPAHTVTRFRQTMDYFQTVIQSAPDKKYVIVGHHAPSHLSVHPRFQNDRIMNGAYYSDLSEFILDHQQIKLWTHGHTHFNFDYKIGDCRIVCNPRGYIGHEPQAEDFKLQYVEV